MLWEKVQELLNKSHNLSHGHDYDALDDEDGCATCRRDMLMERNIDAWKEEMDDIYLSHKV